MNMNKRCKNNSQRKQEEKNCVNKKVVKITKNKNKIKNMHKKFKVSKREEKRKDPTNFYDLLNKSETESMLNYLIFGLIKYCIKIVQTM